MVTPALPAGAQTFPNKPIRLMVGFPPGGGTDITARLLATKLGDHLGQPVVVENRPGAAGTIAAKQIAKSEPDGYRILMTASGTFIHSVLSSGPAYNIESELTPISMVSVSPLVVMVGSSVPVRDIGELIELARSKSGQMTFGSDGIGSTGHLAGELFNSMAKVKMLHVPYKGVAPALNSLLAGETQVIFIPPTIAVQHVKTGKARALGFTGSKRWPLMPEVPTILEAGVQDFEITGSWHGWLAPAKTPPAVIARIQAEAKKALQVPRVREFLVAGGYEPDGSTPEEFRKFLKTESARYAEAVRAAGIKPE
jgi:tripartite-type tricarboxylate transporter receptor subunit TctC